MEETSGISHTALQNSAPFIQTPVRQEKAASEELKSETSTLPKPNPGKWTDPLYELDLPLGLHRPVQKSADLVGAVGSYLGDKLSGHPTAKKILLIILAVVAVCGLMAAIPFIMKGLGAIQGIYKTVKIIAGLALISLIMAGAPLLTTISMGHKANKGILGG